MILKAVPLYAYYIPFCMRYTGKNARSVVSDAREFRQANASGERQSQAATTELASRRHEVRTNSNNT